jgi:hypothetical protein
MAHIAADGFVIRSGVLEGLKERVEYREIFEKIFELIFLALMKSSPKILLTYFRVSLLFHFYPMFRW